MIPTILVLRSCGEIRGGSNPVLGISLTSLQEEGESVRTRVSNGPIQFLKNWTGG